MYFFSEDGILEDRRYQVRTIKQRLFAFESGTLRTEKKGDEFMKLTFLGAAHEVTGSCHMIEACGKIMLVD